MSVTFILLKMFQMLMMYSPYLHLQLLLFHLSPCVQVCVWHISNLWLFSFYLSLIHWSTYYSLTKKLITCYLCYMCFIFIIFYINIDWFFYSICRSCFLVFLEFYVNLTCLALVSVFPSYATIHDLNLSCVPTSVISHLLLFLLSAYAFPEFSPLSPLRGHLFSWWLSSLSQFPCKIWSYASLHLLRHINLRLSHRLCKVSM